MISKVKVWGVAILLVVFLAGPCFASRFGAYENGALKIQDPHHLLVFKEGSATQSRTITVQPERIVRAAWHGRYLELVLEKGGKTHERVYESFDSYQDME